MALRPHQPGAEPAREQGPVRGQSLRPSETNQLSCSGWCPGPRPAQGAPLSTPALPAARRGTETLFTGKQPNRHFLPKSKFSVPVLFISTWSRDPSGHSKPEMAAGTGPLGSAIPVVASPPGLGGRGHGADAGGPGGPGTPCRRAHHHAPCSGRCAPGMPGTACSRGSRERVAALTTCGVPHAGAERPLRFLPVVCGGRRAGGGGPALRSRPLGLRMGRQSPCVCAWCPRAGQALRPREGTLAEKSL